MAQILLWGLWHSMVTIKMMELSLTMILSSVECSETLIIVLTQHLRK